MKARTTACLVAAALVCVSWPLRASAHDPSTTSTSGWSNMHSHDSGGDHRHRVIAWSNLASPVNGAEYTRSYLGGVLPVRSGSFHQVIFETDRACVGECSWHGSVTGGTAGLSSAVDEMSNFPWTLDQNNVFRHYFLVEDQVDLQTVPLGTRTAGATARMLDETFSPAMTSGVATHNHTYTVVP